MSNPHRVVVALALAGILSGMGAACFVDPTPPNPHQHDDDSDPPDAGDAGDDAQGAP